jgi:group I intron endonuclease
MIYTLYQYQHRESGKKYIGITNNVNRRHKQHTQGRSGALAFNRAVIKYGIGAFDFKVLATFDRIVAACYHEQAAIRKFNTLSPNGYNLQAGAPYTQYSGSPAPEALVKRSIALMGNINGKGLKGYHQSAEHRANESASMKGKIRTRGYHRSPEICAKISLSEMGKYVSPKTRKKISESQIGNQKSLGYRRSVETRKKDADARKRWWAIKQAQEDAL